MKLNTLALAVALTIVATPVVADVKLKISGDIGIIYSGDETGDNELGESGSEINFDASEKINGTTFYGHVELDINGTDNPADFEEVRLGAKGKWGEVIIGETDNACDKLDAGGFPDIFLSSEQGSCKGSDISNIVYLRKLNKDTTVAVSHNPNGTEYNALGFRTKVGPVTAFVGYEDGDALGGNDENVTLGLSAKLGAVKLGLRANRADGFEQADVGINAAYEVGANKFYIGLGTTEKDLDSVAVGYNYALSKKTLFSVEVLDNDGDEETEFAVGFRQKF